MTFKNGDQVHVEFDGQVTSLTDDGAMVKVGKGAVAGIYYVPRHVLSKRKPAHWPPQVGDVWAEGPGVTTTWFVRANGYDRKLIMAPAAGHDYEIFPDYSHWLTVYPEGRLLFRQGEET